MNRHLKAFGDLSETEAPEKPRRFGLNMAAIKAIKKPRRIGEKSLPGAAALGQHHSDGRYDDRYDADALRHGTGEDFDELLERPQDEEVRAIAEPVEVVG